MKIRRYLALLPIVLCACIGTDILETEVFPEEIQITSRADTIKVGESFQFRAVFFNAIGEREEVPLLWQTEESGIITIDENGLATAVSPGTTNISVRAGVVSDTVQVTAGSSTVSATPGLRMGTFVGLNNYRVEGSFQMELVNDSFVQLNFESNFSTSNGPGLYVYLSNNQNSVSGGLDLGELKANTGAQTYEFNNPGLFNAYQYVIIYCKPFGVPFGRGTFEN